MSEHRLTSLIISSRTLIYIYDLRKPIFVQDNETIENVKMSNIKKYYWLKPE